MGALDKSRLQRARFLTFPVTAEGIPLKDKVFADKIDGHVVAQVSMREGRWKGGGLQHFSLGDDHEATRPLSR